MPDHFNSHEPDGAVFDHPSQGTSPWDEIALPVRISLWRKDCIPDTGLRSPPAKGPLRLSKRPKSPVQRTPRSVVPRLPRPGTFRRQESEKRQREDHKSERVAVPSFSRRAFSAVRARPLKVFRLRRSAPDVQAASIGDAAAATTAKDRLPSLPSPRHAGTSPIANTNGSDTRPASPRSFHLSDQGSRSSESGSFSEGLNDPAFRQELEACWILNLSLAFRDRTDREKFFVTYAEEPNRWRRVTVSCDYRNVPEHSLEADLKTLRYQRDKSAHIYEAIRESLPSVQFYDTVTNLKLETADKRLHVHVTEDVNEIIKYPPISVVQHLPLGAGEFVTESDLHFASHISGFVYKVTIDGQSYIKKEIPGPDMVDEFLYEINALYKLRSAKNVIRFHALVLNDSKTIIKGLLISFASQGALVDLIYDHKIAPLSWGRRDKWVRQIVSGLSDIHEAGFVQGDFTLSNIVIDDDDDAKIIDINRRGCPVGWEPPEFLGLIESGQRISMYIGNKSDLYQLGMVLWALAVPSDEPERAETPLSVDEAMESGAPRYLKRWISSCLSKDPALRLPAKELLADLNPRQPTLHRSIPGIAGQHDVVSTNGVTNGHIAIPARPEMSGAAQVPSGQEWSTASDDRLPIPDLFPSYGASFPEQDHEFYDTALYRHDADPARASQEGTMDDDLRRLNDHNVSHTNSQHRHRPSSAISDAPAVQEPQSFVEHKHSDAAYGRENLHRYQGPSNHDARRFHLSPPLHQDSGFSGMEDLEPSMPHKNPHRAIHETSMDDDDIPVPDVRGYGAVRSHFSPPMHQDSGFDELAISEATKARASGHIRAHRALATDELAGIGAAHVEDDQDRSRST